MSAAGVKVFTDLGKILTPIMVVCGSVWFFGEPFLEDYVESHIEAYEAKHAQELSGKIKLRTLLAGKMRCDTDEVHIELGKLVRKEKEVYALLDSLEASIKRQGADFKLERRKIASEIRRIKAKIKLD